MRMQARRQFAVGDRVFGGPQVLTCAPLVARDLTDLLVQARQLAELRPDCVEWRCDFLDDLEPEAVSPLLAQISEACGRPLLVTNRLEAEGGARPQDEEKRLAILTAALRSGHAAMVDLELAADPRLAGALVREARGAGVRVVRSWHNFSATPSSEVLLGKLREAQESGADVAKAAVMPQSPEDVLTVLTAGLEARRSFLEIPTVLMAMGPMGAVTRISGGFYGSDLTFAVGSQASAPGQMALDLVRICLAAQGLGGHGQEA